MPKLQGQGEELVKEIKAMGADAVFLPFGCHQGSRLENGDADRQQRLSTDLWMSFLT
jgi:hypothetical protein